MAPFDVYRRRDREQLLVNCQSTTLPYLPTRFVIPLLPLADVPSRVERLHPTMLLGSERYVLATHYAMSVPVDELAKRVGSLEHEHHRITDAIDMLLSGF